MNDDHRQVCLLTTDAVLGASVSRLAAAAGALLEIEADLDRLAATWTAPVVLIGTDLLPGVAAIAPVRRDRVLVVGEGTADLALEDVLVCGAEAVLELPAHEDALMALLADIDRVRRASVIGVIGGSGGAGASTFAAALAQTCARDGPSLLIDGDVLGAGVDQVLGLDPAAGVRWDSLLGASGRLAGRALREALPRSGPLSVLAWPVERLEQVDATGVRAVTEAAVRGFETVIVDLPRGADPIADALLRRCDRVVLVVESTVPGSVAAARVTRRLLTPVSLLVVRRRSGGVEAADVARFLGVEHAIAMTDQRGIDEDIALGAGPVRRSRGPLARAARDVAAALGVTR